MEQNPGNIESTLSDISNSLKKQFQVISFYNEFIIEHSFYQIKSMNLSLLPSMNDEEANPDNDPGIEKRNQKKRDLIKNQEKLVTDFEGKIKTLREKHRVTE